MNTKNLPTKNNLIKIKNSIKQSKEGQMLLEQKRIILTKELDNYINQYNDLKIRGQHLFEQAYNALKLANVEIRNG